jgi:hypothetical protein
MNIYRKIAKVVTLFEVDDSLTDIPEFLNGIGENDAGSTFDCLVKFNMAPENSIILSDDHKVLTICGPNINNLRNPFNYIGFLQAITRFIALHSFKRGIFLMHGSAANLDGNAIVFGDDGSSTAKTLSALEVAINSKKYIVDEFCFYDIKKNEVFSIGKIPVHLRDVVHENFKKRGLFVDVKNEYFENSSAGIFFFSNDYFKNEPIGKVTAMFFTHFTKDKPKKIMLSGENKLDAISFCVTAQIAKLLYPDLDRMSFAAKNDTTEIKEYDQSCMTSVLKMVGGNKYIEKISEKIQCYQILIQDSRQIINLVKD